MGDVKSVKCTSGSPFGSFWAAMFLKPSLTNEDEVLMWRTTGSFIHLSYPFSAFLLEVSLSFCRFWCSSYVATSLYKNVLNNYSMSSATSATTTSLKATRELTHWCRCQSPRGTPPCADRKEGGTRGASGSAGRGRNKPRSPPRSAARPRCIPAPAGSGRVWDSPGKPHKY